jgi:hypothetical protein
MAALLEGRNVNLWITISRVLVGVVGIAAVLATVGNLVTGGGALTDPSMLGGVVVGLSALGAAAWTTSPVLPRAVVVWLGVLAIIIALVAVWATVGTVQTQDLLVYVGIPTGIALLATLGIAVGRWRAGALGAGAAGTTG